MSSILLSIRSWMFIKLTDSHSWMYISQIIILCYPKLKTVLYVNYVSIKLEEKI